MKQNNIVNIKKLESLSAFLPAYNEATNIREAVRQLKKALRIVAKKYEIIIINDGSKDATLQIAKDMASVDKTIRVVNQRNTGYGGALKRGFKEAKFDWVFFTDSDLQFNMSELTKLVKKTDKYELVLGYRLNRAEGNKRKFVANLLKLWNRFWLSFPAQIKDIDCAFKLINKKVLVQIQPLISDGAMISTELLLKAYKKDFAFTQVGVRHYSRLSGEATGNNLKVILKAVKDTFIIRAQIKNQYAGAKIYKLFRL